MSIEVELLSVVSLLAGAIAVASSISQFMKGRKARKQMVMELEKQKLELLKELENAKASKIDSERLDRLQNIYAKYLETAYMHLTEDNKANFAPVVTHLSPPEKAAFAKELLSDNKQVTSDAK